MMPIRRARHGTGEQPRAAGRAAAVLLCLSCLAGCQEVLYSGLDEQEANRMRQALMRQGIDASRRVGDDGKHTVEVHQDDVGRALRTLEAAGLPRSKFASTMDLIKSDALVASPAEDRARLSFALSQELASTLSTIDGVVSARVHVVLPEKPVLGVNKTAQPSASVFIKHRPAYNLQSSNLAIRQLVAKSVEGLSPDQVSVTLWPAAPHELGETLEPARERPIAFSAPWALALGLVIGGLGGWWWTRQGNPGGPAAGALAGLEQRLPAWMRRRQPSAGR